MIDIKNIYPLTIIKDRYNGVYSGGKYTAWNMEPEEIPSDVIDTDEFCCAFWEYNKKVAGIGDTPDEAVENLFIKLIKKEIIYE